MNIKNRINKLEKDVKVDNNMCLCDGEKSLKGSKVLVQTKEKPVNKTAYDITCGKNKFTDVIIIQGV